MKKCHVVGFGFDSHRYARSGTLKLGGIAINRLPALKGHSDGDALIHAVIDALLGATGLGDIGEFFPDTNKKIKGISSVIMLKRVLGRMRKRKARIQHLDITVLANKPKLKPIKPKIRKNLSSILNVPPKSINIKAKTHEGIKLTSAMGGVAVWAVATMKIR